MSQDKAPISAFEDIALALSQAYERGQESMRERAAKACDKEKDEAKRNGLPHVAMGASWCAPAIRSLPIEQEGGE